MSKPRSRGAPERAADALRWRKEGIQARAWGEEKGIYAPAGLRSAMRAAIDAISSCRVGAVLLYRTYEYS